MKRWFPKIKQWTTTIWPAMIWSALIFVALMTPSDNLPNGYFDAIPHLDKWVHIILFCGFAFFWNIFFYHSNLKDKERIRFWLILLITALYGIILEYLQLLVERNFDIYDWLADITGTLLILTIKPKTSNEKNLR